MDRSLNQQLRTREAVPFNVLPRSARAVLARGMSRRTVCSILEERGKRDLRLALPSLRPLALWQCLQTLRGTRKLQMRSAHVTKHYQAQHGEMLAILLNAVHFATRSTAVSCSNGVVKEQMLASSSKALQPAVQLASQAVDLR